MNQKRGSEAAIAEILELGRGIRVSEMVTVAEAAQLAGGSLVGVDPIDGDWCGTGRIRIKWPPKKDGYLSLLESLVSLRVDHEIIINGIPVPDEILLTLRRQGWVAGPGR